MRILLAEDNRSIATLVTMILEQAGHSVVVTDNGLEALQQVLLQHPDAAVLDGNMPILNGWEACRRIKEHANVPVMLLTVHGQPRDRELAECCGVDAYVAKPFDIDVFLQELNRLLPA